jgi:HPt (histidine-containing phosphotransfer) domain-containing protein
MDIATVYEQLDLLANATSVQATEEIIELFLKNTPSRVANMREALDHLDFVLIKNIAHQMKSSCGYLGLQDLQETFVQIETNANAKDFSHFDRYKSLLESQFAQGSSFLRQYLEQGKQERRASAYDTSLSH